MSLKNFFTRNSESTSTHVANEVICDTEELKDFITKWAKNSGWKFEDFAIFIKLVGVKTPVKLSELDKEKQAFKCVTELNTEVTISLIFGNWGVDDYYPEIHVTEGEEIREFEANGNFGKVGTVPEVTLMRRTITRNGKELRSFYCNYFFDRTLILDATRQLNVQIHEPTRNSCDTHEVAVLKNCQLVEEYLLGLDNSLEVAQVYDKLIGLLGFSDEDISNSGRILISYIETIDKEEITRGKILMQKGKMKEYAVTENKETFHVFKDGSWKYISDDDIRIDYLRGKEQTIFSISGTEEKIINVKPSEIIKRVKSKIERLKKLVK